MNCLNFFCCALEWYEITLKVLSKKFFHKTNFFLALLVKSTDSNKYLVWTRNASAISFNEFAESKPKKVWNREEQPTFHIIIIMKAFWKINSNFLLCLLWDLRFIYVSWCEIETSQSFRSSKWELILYWQRTAQTINTKCI